MDQDEFANKVVASTWGTAIKTAIALLEDLAVKMEAGEMPTPCGVCALRGAAGILRDSETKRGRIDQMMGEAVGHA